MRPFFNKRIVEAAVLPSSNRVIHREIGTYPNLLPAQDIFVNIPEAEMQKAVAVRCEGYCNLVKAWMDGTITHRDFMNHPMHRTDVELSVIKNPAKPYEKAR